MRITHVRSARKSQGTCGKCGTAIPKGAGYKWIKHRYGAKQVRCAACPTWRPSEMSQGKIATAYAAQEGGHDSLDAIEQAADVDSLVDDIKAALQDVASGAEDCKSDYEDGLGNMPDSLQDGPTGQDIQERIDTLDEWISNLKNWSPDDDQPPSADDYDDTDALADATTQWIEDTIASGRECIDELML